MVNGKSLVTRDAIKVSFGLLWSDAQLTKQNSLEQIGDVKTVVSGDRNGYVSFSETPTSSELTSRSTRPNFTIAETPLRPSASSMVLPPLVVDSRYLMMMIPIHRSTTLWALQPIGLELSGILPSSFNDLKPLVNLEPMSLVR